MVYVDSRDVEATHNPADGIWFEGMGEIPACWVLGTLVRSPGHSPT